MGREAQGSGTQQLCKGLCCWGRGDNPLLERAPGHGKGPSVVWVGVGKLQAGFQAGSSQPDPWEGLKGE